MSNLHELNQDLENLRMDLRNFQMKLYEFMTSTEEEVKRIGVGILQPGDYVDHGILCRDIEELFEELRKEVKARKELCAKLIAVETMRSSLESGNSGTASVRGFLGIATPDVKIQPKIPNKGTPEYFELMKAVGVSDELLKDNAPVKFDWDKLGEFVTKRIKDGKPVPAGVTQTYTQFVATFRRHSKNSRNSKEEL